MNKVYVFFVGTEAELIKLFPVIKEFEKRKIVYYLVASGQNDIRQSKVLVAANGGRIDLCLSSEQDIKKTAGGLLHWYLQTKRDASTQIKNLLGENVDYANSWVMVHGDTISTVMGAYAAKRLGMKVAHIEAGLRSHNYLNPFPEEIDRMLVSRVAFLHFAPGQQATDNLSGKVGVINTEQNTLFDSLRYAEQVPCEDQRIKELQKQPYFVFVIHRQENLANDEFVKAVMRNVDEAASQMKCVVILHKITELKLEQLGLLNQIKQDSRYICFSRVEYFDFMKLLSHSKYVITDGGSNQEELYYMGKPALIMRKTTERNEGLGHNAKLYGGDADTIREFSEHYREFEKEPIETDITVSELIVDTITN